MKSPVLFANNINGWFFQMNIAVCVSGVNDKDSIIVDPLKLKLSLLYIYMVKQD